ncbi:hypothetical protein [Streptomyces bullii]|uniref:Scaffolding protein n=1 Tax=Streptomyces bullii TaxID=349910 RepID=A0ABW0UMI1_9ACTN
MADENTSVAESEDAATASETPDIRSQADEGLGDAGKKALQEERRKARAAERQLGELQKRLQEYEDRGKTETQKLAEAKTAAEQEAAETRQELMRFRVAAAKKLPVELAGRLRGATEEEMSEDADSLLALFTAQQQRQTPNYDGGVRQTAQQPASMSALIRRAAGY